jgi:hypothetical protein
MTLNIEEQLSSVMSFIRGCTLKRVVKGTFHKPRNFGDIQVRSLIVIPRFLFCVRQIPAAVNNGDNGYVSGLRQINDAVSLKD